MRPNVTIASTENLTPVAADCLATLISASIAARGACRFALAGGSTPRPVYEALAAAPLSGRVDWTRVHVFFGDERCVPPEDDASNYRMARAALLDRVPVPKGQVFRIPGELPPEQAAATYAEALGEQPLDVVLLGMGDDGHTASIFPATVERSGPRVMATSSPLPPADRVSLTTAALCEAREVVFVVSGEKKARRVAEVFAQLDSPSPSLPAARVRPKQGSLRWILDEPAASKLETGS